MVTITRLQPRATVEETFASPEAAAAAETLAVSFGPEDVTRALNGDDPNIGRLRMLASVTTSVTDLEAYVANPDGSPEGSAGAVMLVKPPGFEHGKSANAKGPHTAAADAIMAEKPELQKAFSEIIAFFNHIEEKAFGAESVTPTYYISHLGTLPESQRKGLAGALLNMIKQRASKEGKRLTLLTMTEGNVKYYERFGFKVLYYDEVTLNKIPTRWWVMAVEPETSANGSANGSAP